jgi:hypothetical protein
MLSVTRPDVTPKRGINRSAGIAATRLTFISFLIFGEGQTARDHSQRSLKSLYPQTENELLVYIHVQCVHRDDRDFGVPGRDNQRQSDRRVHSPSRHYNANRRRRAAHVLASDRAKLKSPTAKHTKKKCIKLLLRIEKLKAYAE